MFNLLGFFFILIIAVLVIGVAIVGTFLRAIFGLGRRTSSHQQTYQRSSPHQESSDWQNIDTGEVPEDAPKEPRTKRQHKKIFAKDEGEYVDFEEI